MWLFWLLFFLLYFHKVNIHTTALYIMVFIMVLFMMTMLKWPCIFICFQCFFWMSEADISKNILIQSNIDFMFLIINYKYSDFDWLDMDLWILFIHLYFIVFTLLIDWLIDIIYLYVGKKFKWTEELSDLPQMHPEMFLYKYNTISAVNYCVPKVYPQEHIYLWTFMEWSACQILKEFETGHCVYVISKLQHYISDYLLV